MPEQADYHEDTPTDIDTTEIVIHVICHTCQTIKPTKILAEQLLDYLPQPDGYFIPIGGMCDKCLLTQYHS